MFVCVRHFSMGCNSRQWDTLYLAALTLVENVRESKLYFSIMLRSTFLPKKKRKFCEMVVQQFITQISSLV